jgi:MFS family permease
MDPQYRRLWASILISSLGGQITLLAIPLTAALLLNASPVQMGWLTAMELVPFGLFALPVGVWLDRMRKLPVYVWGELLMAIMVGSVPLAWWLGCLSMTWLWTAAFGIGVLYTSAGSAAQIVLTQIVERDRLVEAHARNSLASSTAEVAGPGLAGILIRLLGAPAALIADVAMLALSAVILRGIRIHESPQASGDAFWQQMQSGLRFVWRTPVLRFMAVLVGVFQICYQGALVVQILVATRVLGLSEHQVGLCFVALGIGTVMASVVGHRVATQFGPGPTMAYGIALCGIGWITGAVAPTGWLGVLALVVMLSGVGFGAVLVFINLLALRQSVTPQHFLGRMTAAMRWASVLPGIPGALLAGWLGEHVGLKLTLGACGLTALVAAWVALRSPLLLSLRQLPVLDRDLSGPVGSVLPTMGSD